MKKKTPKNNILLDVVRSLIKENGRTYRNTLRLEKKLATVTEQLAEVQSAVIKQRA